MAKTQKTVDLTKDKTSPYVRASIRKVDKVLADQVKQCNIPVFSILSKNITTEFFFQNYTDFHAILGDNIKLLERMMVHAICTVLTDDISEAMDKAKGFVGVWDQHTIYNILTAGITFMKNSDTDELYYTAEQYVSMNTEEINALPEGAAMAFSEYNPNRFVQITLKLRDLAVSTISNIMKSSIPSIFAYQSGSNPQLKIYELMRTYMENDLQKSKELLQGEIGEFDLHVAATEKLVRIFIDYYEKPFMTMVAIALRQAGFSDNVVNLMLGTCRLHLMFDDPVGKELGDVGIGIRLTAKLNDKTTYVQYSTNIGKEYEMILTDPELLSKTKRETYGKSLRKFILDFSAFTANVYMEIIRNNKKQNEAESVPSAFEESPIENIDVEEFDKLLEADDAEESGN